DDQHRHDNLTPEELWTRKKPNVTHLQVFGCETYVLNKENNRSKFDKKADKCLFLGYKDGAYKLWNPNKRRIVISHDVTFKERQEPSVKETDTYIPGVQTSQSTSTSTSKQRTSSMTSSSVPNQTSSVPESQEKSSSSSEPLPPMEPIFEGPRIVELKDESVQGTSSSSSGTESGDEPLIRKSSKGKDKKKQPRRSRVLETNLGSYWDTQGSSRRKEKDQVNYAQMECAYSAVVGEPSTYEEATRSDDAIKWKQAMDEEYNSLIQNDTWDLVPLPEGRKAIGSRWVYKIKKAGDGSIERYKA